MSWSLSAMKALLHEPLTLEAALARRDDNFLLLRFIAASAVLFGHGAGWYRRRPEF
jgi:hypothetical protein